MQSYTATDRTHQKRCIKLLCILMAAVLLLPGCAPAEKPVKIGVSQTLQNQILAYMAAELAKEQNVPAEVIVIDGGTGDIQPALVSGSLDGTVEFAQSAWSYVLKRKGDYTGSRLKDLQEAYARDSLQWFPISMVVDHYTLAVRHDVVRDHSLQTLSGLARISDQLVFGADSGYFEREDGFPRLQQAYHFSFANTRNLPYTDLYEYLKDDAIQVMPVYSLSGSLDEEEMFILEDDLEVYPDSTAALVFSDAVLEKYPVLAQIAGQIGSTLTTRMIRHLMRLVEKGNLSSEEAALFFCKAQGWIEEPVPESILEN